MWVVCISIRNIKNGTLHPLAALVPLYYHSGPTLWYHRIVRHPPKQSPPLALKPRFATPAASTPLMPIRRRFPVSQELHCATRPPFVIQLGERSLTRITAPNTTVMPLAHRANKKQQRHPRRNAFVISAARLLMAIVEQPRHQRHPPIVSVMVAVEPIKVTAPGRFVQGPLRSFANCTTKVGPP
jgi:hypothetical protein